MPPSASVCPSVCPSVRPSVEAHSVCLSLAILAALCVTVAASDGRTDADEEIFKSRGVFLKRSVVVVAAAVRYG